MIPLEATKAATQAFIEHGTLIPALEAAAPYMLAAAWSQGFTAASEFPHEGINPYRPEEYRQS